MNRLFREGETGTLMVWVDRPMAQGDILALADRIDGKAFHLLQADFDSQHNTLLLDFEAGIFWLPLVALALGVGGIFIVGWKLLKSANVWQELKRIALPSVAMLGGAAVMAVGGTRWPGLLAGAGLMGGGFYLAWRELARPPEGYTALSASYWVEWEGSRQSGVNLPLREGTPFGATLTFQHRGSAEKPIVGVWADIEGRRVWAGPSEVVVAEDAEWESYSVEVQGIMSIAPLALGRRVDIVESLQAPSGTLEIRRKGVFYVAVPAVQARLNLYSMRLSTP